ncbi:CACTA en-spm transposon protein [Cucumis melo var. makuwa]|uniref:CACTA en-spm transposon protein n=1 Tax=Cucumis melo var. makuwa TaxID=1194695 RepID=A0A5A7TZU0_CUCMM|nr:CACTA en-spm transposon protein [Cucumis melo var. makuwa]TYK18168.1 CACTA en-spm transposon protein [Cucumis melo var. makuwa]
MTQKNSSNWKVVQIIQNKRIWDVPEVDDAENEDLNVLEIVVDYRVDEHIEDDTLCRTDVNPTIIERSVVRIMSFPCTNFLETDAMFLKFADDLDNLAGGSSSVGSNSANGWIPMTIALGQAIAMKRFVERQMLTTFKEFQGNYHRHFKKYSDPEEARTNALGLLVGRDEDLHFLCDHYTSRAFQVSN